MSCFAPALHPTSIAIPPFGPSSSDNNLDGNNSGVKTKHEWFDESLFAGFSQDVSSNTEVIAIDVHLIFFFSLHIFIKAIMVRFGSACSCFSQCRS